MSTRTKSKGATARRTNTSSDEDDTDSQPKTWFQRWGYIALIIIIVAILIGGVGFYLVRRAYLKAILVPVSDVTPAMLPIQVPGSTFSYFSLPDGVKNWNPEAANTSAASAAGAPGGIGAAGGGDGRMIAAGAAPIGGGGYVAPVAGGGYVAGRGTYGRPTSTSAADLEAAAAAIRARYAARRGGVAPPIQVAPVLGGQPVAAAGGVPPRAAAIVVSPAEAAAAAAAAATAPSPVRVPVAAGAPAYGLREGYAKGFLAGTDFE